jgi:hypothetical protein
MAKLELPSDLGTVDLTTVETGIPVLPAGDYLVRLVSMEQQTSKNGKPLLVIKVETAEDSEDEKGNTVNAGFPLFDRISLTPTENYNPARRLAELQEAFLGEKRPEFDTDDFIDGEARIKLKIEESDEFGRQNRVARYLPKRNG